MMQNLKFQFVLWADKDNKKLAYGLFYSNVEVSSFFGQSSLPAGRFGD
jgi:hypothetical protein